MDILSKPELEIIYYSEINGNYNYFFSFPNKVDSELISTLLSKINITRSYTIFNI